MFAAKVLANYYRDWLNNYLTVELFAEHNTLEVSEAIELINLGRIIHEKRLGDYSNFG